MPSVSGIGTVFSGTLDADSGNMAADYTQIGGAYKTDLTSNLGVALIIDQPFGANVAYPAAPISPPGPQPS